MDKLTSRFTIAMTQIPCFWSDLSNLVIVVKILPTYLYLLTNTLYSYFCVVFCRLLFVLLFVFFWSLYIVFPSSIYGFWLPLWTGIFKHFCVMLVVNTQLMLLLLTSIWYSIASNGLLLYLLYNMWTKVIPFPPSSLYISYKTVYYHNILMKSFLIWFSWNFQH